MPSQHEVLRDALLAILALGAATVRSFTGFGIALAFVPLASVIENAKSVVVVANLLNIGTTLPLLLDLRAGVRVREVSWLVVGFAVGAPVGAVLLRELSTGWIKIAVAVGVVVMAALVWAQRERVRIRSSAGGALGVGAFSGLLRSTTGMGGPPVVFYLLGRGFRAEELRGTMVAYIVPSGIIGIASLAAAGQIHRSELTLAMLLAPFVAGGLLLGRRFRSFVSEAAFVKVVLGLLIASSLASLGATVLARL